MTNTTTRSLRKQVKPVLDFSPPILFSMLRHSIGSQFQGTSTGYFDGALGIFQVLASQGTER